MNDITTQIQSALKDIIKGKLKSVGVIQENYRKLDDLRIILASTFPKEKAFKNNESTELFLRKILSDKDIVFKNETVDNKAVAVYFVPDRKPNRPEGRKNGNQDNEKPNRPEGRKNGNQDNERPNRPEGRKNGNQDNERPNRPEGRKNGNQDNEKPNRPEGNDRRTYFMSKLREFAFFPNIEETLGRIAGLAKEEIWKFGTDNNGSQFPILESYLSQVIERLKYEKDTLGLKDKIIITHYVNKNKEGQSVTREKCVINTGLVSKKGNFIYMLFNKNNRSDAQYWIFQDVSDDVKNQIFLPFKGNLPKRADFYKKLSLSTVTYSKNVESVNVGHILLTRCERLPIDFLKHHFGDYFKSTDVSLKTAKDWDRFKKYIENPAQSFEFEAASHMLQMCIEKAEKAAQSDDSLKVNIYRQSEHSVGFFLPLYLVKPKDDKDFEIGVIIDNSNGSYVARTIYRTSMAYPRIRVMGNHNRRWLDPTRISDWKDPYKEEKKQK